MTFSEIPVINYHKIEPESDIGITTRHPDRFERDLQLLATEGFQTITFQEYASGITLPEKPLLITFDDAYDSVYDHAFPQMTEYGFKAVVFVPTDYIGQTNNWDVQFGGRVYGHLDESRLKELYSKGFELGSHGISHRLFRNMETDELRRELRESKSTLERITGTPVRSISYPFGRYNNTILKNTAEAGYQFGVGAVRFGQSGCRDQNLCIRRFNIYRHDSDKTFLTKASLAYESMVGIRDWCIQKGGLATALYQEWFFGKNRKTTSIETEIKSGS